MNADFYKPGAQLRRNWPGALSILLAIASVGAYWLPIALGPPPPDSSGSLDQFLFWMSLLGAATSALVGFLAVSRARRGGGGLATSIISLLLGGTLTLLWVVWIGGLTLFPGALGGD